MDPIDRAVRLYRQIEPNPIGPWPKSRVRKLVTWLKDDVTPIVAGYVGRPSFQNAACWPLREFACGAKTPARTAVDQVSAALVQCARDIQKALESRRLAAATEQNLVQKDAMSELRSQVASTAKPFWTDLVSPEDYFGPRAGWLDARKVETSTIGEFVLAFNPELHSVGDFVTRCLTRRVDVLTREVESHGQAVLRAARSLGRNAPKAVAAIPVSLECFRTATRELDVICRQEPDAMIRDSCIVLTQTYNAYCANPDIVWLGRPATEQIIGRAVLKQRIEHLHDTQVTDRIAQALGDLQRLYDTATPGQSLLDEAVAGGGLVLTDPPAAYWAGEAIECDWSRHSQCWKLLQKLAIRARLAAEVPEADLYSTSASLSTMANLASRLKALLPPGLRREIVPGLSPRSYRLKLPSERIHILNRPVPKR